MSFSGGKDSTVLAKLVRDMYPDVPIVFSNTGLEYPEIQSFARKMGATFVRPKMAFSDVISKYGYPIISKENADAIYYARHIKNGNAYRSQPERSTAGKRMELEGKREKKNTLPPLGKRNQLLGKTQISGEGVAHEEESLPG